MKPYLFTSGRLGFRNWEAADLNCFSELNADPRVMEFFPSTLKRSESKALMARLQNQFAEKGYTYFSTEVKKTGKWIGFIGLSYQDYPADFTPAVDIGWRLIPEAWGKGYASEGARRCLDYAFETRSLDRIVSVCPRSNTNSERVMKRIGMQRQSVFIHPKLIGYPHLEDCLWYEISRARWEGGPIPSRSIN
jgi:RimJ/RimL family protein N-acetyltransferase